MSRVESGFFTKPYLPYFTEDAFPTHPPTVLHAPCRSVVEGGSSPSNPLFTVPASMQAGEYEEVRLLTPGLARVPLKLQGPGTVKPGCYTAAPSEVPALRTPIDARSFVSAVLKFWPTLGGAGAHMLVVVSSFETGGWARCYNYNLGNQKPYSTTSRHVYLRNTWEVMSAVSARQLLAEGRVPEGSVSPPPSEWKLGTRVKVIFQPPDAASCFAAFDSFDAGVAAVVHIFRRMAQRCPELLAALQSSETQRVAQLLRQERYFTGDEQTYAQGLLREFVRLGHL